MPSANLTRFGPSNLERVEHTSTQVSDTFRSMAGPAQLAVTLQDALPLSVVVNGSSVLTDEEAHPAGEHQLDIDLQRENTIEIRVPAGQPSPVTIRIRQRAETELGVLRQGYFGLNTSDMARQRELYAQLGFVGEIFPAGPETSTTFARSLGFEDDYLIYVSLHSLENPPLPPFVDTVQFREAFYRDEPPYRHLNHLGMAYATYATSDIDSAFAYLQSKQIETVSEPVTAPSGERFLFFKDQDGAYIKLTQDDEGDAVAAPPHLKHLANTNMNVSDLERSREFYRLLGFSESVSAGQSGEGAFALAHGFEEAIEFLGEDISLGGDTDGATLQLRQWITPFDDAPPYSPPVNHLGIDRINFYVTDLTATIRAMNELGFEQLGPIGGSPEIGIVFFFDPDGIKVQFAGPQLT